MRNDINSLRDTLFETLRALRDRDNPIEIDRAKAINDTAQTIINCAKVEVDYMRVSGVKVTGGFVSQKPQPEKQIQTLRTTRSGVCQVESVPGGTVTTHRMRV